MNQSSEISSRVERLVNQALNNNPRSSDILNAFKPVIAGRIRTAGSFALKEFDHGSIDRSRLRGGVPLIRQMALLTEDVPAPEIALALIPDIKQGLKGISEEIDILEKGIKDGHVDLHGYFRAYPDGTGKLVDDWAAHLGIKPSAIDFVCRTVTRIVLEKRGSEALDQLEDFDWEKGYCPVCGAFPAVSMIQEKGGQRWLHCSECGYEWRFSRVICPYCEHEGQEGMTYYYVEDRSQDSAFICEKCSRYLITLSKVGDLEDRDFEISAISLVHLDMIMQDRGYLPMAECAWNSFRE